MVRAVRKTESHRIETLMDVRDIALRVSCQTTGSPHNFFTSPTLPLANLEFMAMKRTAEEVVSDKSMTPEERDRMLQSFVWHASRAYGLIDMIASGFKEELALSKRELSRPRIHSVDKPLEVEGKGLIIKGKLRRRLKVAVDHLEEVLSEIGNELKQTTLDVDPFFISRLESLIAGNVKGEAEPKDDAGPREALVENILEAMFTGAVESMIKLLKRLKEEDIGQKATK